MALPKIETLLVPEQLSPATHYGHSYNFTVEAIYASQFQTWIVVEQPNLFIINAIFLVFHA